MSLTTHGIQGDICLSRWGKVCMSWVRRGGMRSRALRNLPYLLVSQSLFYFYTSIPEIKHPYLQLTKLNTTSFCFWLRFKWGAGSFEGRVTSSSLAKMKEKNILFFFHIRNVQIIWVFVLRFACCSISAFADGMPKQDLECTLDTSVDVEIVYRQLSTDKEVYTAFLMCPKTSSHKCI